MKLLSLIVIFMIVWVIAFVVTALFIMFLAGCIAFITWSLPTGYFDWYLFIRGDLLFSFVVTIIYLLVR